MSRKETSVGKIFIWHEFYWIDKGGKAMEICQDQMRKNCNCVKKKRKLKNKMEKRKMCMNEISRD